MSLKSFSFLLSILVLVASFSSCSPQNKIVKSGTPEEKFELAKTHYDKQNYHRAFPIFQELSGLFRDAKKSEEVYYYMAYSLYGMGEFESAARYFYNFTESFVNSSKTEECFFMYCLCMYHAADPYYLDQALTKKAIENFQLFSNLFPGSRYQIEVNMHIDELRRKLKMKSLSNAMQYYKMEDYKAAIVTLKLCIETYPDIEEKEEIEYLILKSAYKYASLSIENKQLERYKEALVYFQDYMDENNYQSKHFYDADDIKYKIETAIIKLEQNQL